MIGGRGFGYSWEKEDSETEGPLGSRPADKTESFEDSFHPRTTPVSADSRARPEPTTSTDAPRSTAGLYDEPSLAEVCKSSASEDSAHDHYSI